MNARSGGNIARRKECLLIFGLFGVEELINLSLINGTGSIVWYLYVRGDLGCL